MIDRCKIKEWLCKDEQLFVIDNTTDETKVGITLIHFDGEKSTSHQALMKEYEEVLVLRSWRGYKNRLKESFEEVLDDSIVEPKELRETKGITEYYAKFELIRTRLRMSEEY